MSLVSPPGVTPAHQTIPLVRKDIASIIKIYAWTLWRSFRTTATRFLSPVGYIGIIAIVGEIVLEFADATNRLVHVTRFVSAMVLIVLVALIGFKRTERRDHHRLALFLRKANEAVAALRELSDMVAAEPGRGSEILKTCVEKILQLLLDAFEGLGSLNANAMLPKVEGKEQFLEMRFVKVARGVEYDRNFKPRLGEGLAGRCFAQRAILYLPRLEWSHGIQVKLPERLGGKPGYSVCLNLYKAIGPEFERHYRSILSVPIVAFCECYGVLNLDSRNPDPFSDNDYLAVTFFGAIIGIALDRYARVYGLGTLSREAH